MTKFCIIAVAMLMTNMYVYTMDPEAEMDLETEQYHLKAELKSNWGRLLNQFPSDGEPQLKVTFRIAQIGYLLLEKPSMNETQKKALTVEARHNLARKRHLPITCQETNQLTERNSQILERLHELDNQLSQIYAMDHQREMFYLTKERDANNLRLQRAGTDSLTIQRQSLSVRNYEIECHINRQRLLDQTSRKDLLDELKRNLDSYETYLPQTPEEKIKLIARNNQISARIEELQGVQDLMRIRNDVLANQQ